MRSPRMRCGSRNSARRSTSGWPRSRRTSRKGRHGAGPERRGLQRGGRLARAPGAAWRAQIHRTRLAPRARDRRTRADRNADPRAIAAGEAGRRRAPAARAEATSAASAEAAAHDDRRSARSAGTPPGSLRHFAVLYSREPARPLLGALYAFEAEIRDTVRATNHEVAHTRLQWWRGEIDRLVAGQAEHPVDARARCRCAVPAPIVPLLHEAMVAADIDLARMTLTSREVSSTRTASAAVGSAAVAGRARVRRLAPASVDGARFARELGAAIAGRSNCCATCARRWRRAACACRWTGSKLRGVDPARLLRPDTAAGAPGRTCSRMARRRVHDRARRAAIRCLTPRRTRRATPGTRACRVAPAACSIVSTSRASCRGLAPKCRPGRGCGRRGARPSGTRDLRPMLAPMARREPSV